MTRKLLTLALVLLSLFCSCATSPESFLTPSEREEVVSIAEKYFGMPYEWGGQSWWWEEEGGIDCSGLVVNVYKEALGDSGRRLPFDDATSSDMASKHTEPVSAPEKGDLVFFNDGDGGPVNHVGIVVELDGDVLTFIDSTQIEGLVDGVSERERPAD